MINYFKNETESMIISHGRMIADIKAVAKRNPEAISEFMLSCGDETIASVINYLGSRINEMQFSKEKMKNLHENLSDAGIFLIKELMNVEKETKENGQRKPINGIKPRDEHTSPGGEQQSNERSASGDTVSEEIPEKFKPS